MPEDVHEHTADGYLRTYVYLLLCTHKQRPGVHSAEVGAAAQGEWGGLATLRESARGRWTDPTQRRYLAVKLRGPFPQSRGMEVSHQALALCVCVCVHAHMCVDVHVWMCVRVRVRGRGRVLVCVCVCVCAHVRVCTFALCACAHTQMYVDVPVWMFVHLGHKTGLCVCAARVRVCEHTCVCLRVCAYVCVSCPLHTADGGVSNPPGVQVSISTLTINAEHEKVTRLSSDPAQLRRSSSVLFLGLLHCEKSAVAGTER